MRLVKEIPHEHYFIQIHEYNGKYILKIGLDEFEQSYKFSTSVLESLDRLEESLTQEFYLSCLKRFMSMREDYVQLLNAKQ